MHRPDRIIVANWKMQFTVNEAATFAQSHFVQLDQLAQENRCSIVICPSFEALYPIKPFLKGLSKLSLGAQNCSLFARGAFTSQVSMLSLAELGCTFCIIGHQEVRELHRDTDHDVANKAALACRLGVSPIICIGETLETFNNGTSRSYLEKQLTTILKFLVECARKTPAFLLAYEPIWAIGSGKTPEPSYLADVLAWIKEMLASRGLSCPLLYGGSISESTIGPLSALADLDGFLIGSASVDFQKFKNIVSWKS